MEEEKVRKIAEIRELLEEKIKNLEAEIGMLRILLEFANNLLIEKSFKRVEEIAKITPTKTIEAVPVTPIKEPVKAIPLRTASGDLLANLYIEDKNLRVVPDADKKFDINTPPFKAFLIEKVLAKMRDSDQESVRKGELMPNDALSFDVKTDGDIIREMLIRNLTPQRERELRSAIRWTLEKMYEKTMGSQP